MKDTDELFNITPIWNCEHAFEYQCPQLWSSLAKTDEKGVRYCDKCDEKVTLCHTPEQFVELGNAGKCVAVPDGKGPLQMNMVHLGRPSPQHIEAQKKRRHESIEWWTRAIELESGFAPKAFAAIKAAIQDSK